MSVFFGTYTLQNFQFEFPKLMLCEFVRVGLPRVSNWAKFAVQISKAEAPTPLLTVGLLFIFMNLSHAHLTTLKIHSVSQTPPKFKQRTSLEVVNNSGKEATSLMRIHSHLHKLWCQHGASAYRPLPGDLGSRSKKKERAVMGSLGQSGLS